MEMAAAHSRPPFQFSLRAVFLLFVAVALILTAMRKSSQVWADAFVTISFTAVLVAIVLAIYGRECQRPARIGFALFAGVYFLLSFRYSDNPVVISLATT